MRNHSDSLANVASTTSSMSTMLSERPPDSFVARLPAGSRAASRAGIRAAGPISRRPCRNGHSLLESPQDLSPRGTPRASHAGAGSTSSDRLCVTSLRAECDSNVVQMEEVRRVRELPVASSPTRPFGSGVGSRAFVGSEGHGRDRRTTRHGTCACLAPGRSQRRPEEPDSGSADPRPKRHIPTTATTRPTPATTPIRKDNHSGFMTRPAPGGGDGGRGPLPSWGLLLQPGPGSDTWEVGRVQTFGYDSFVALGLGGSKPRSPNGAPGVGARRRGPPSTRGGK